MADSLPRIIGKQIIAARVSRGWSQADLANNTDISQGTISRYESGDRRSPDASNLMKIADATGVTVDFLLGREKVNVAERVKASRERAISDVAERIRASGVLAALGEHYAEMIAELAESTGVTIEYLLEEC